MDELYYKIQSYLQKKDQECGQLKFLTSRTTEENIKCIEEVCESISGFLKTLQISTNCQNLKNNQDCVQVFKYLALNTAFKCQIYLLEDIVNGHLADMFPPLSPYLFLEIIQHINFEEILVESILYMPLDLCVEILEISKRSFEHLNFDRSFNALITMISNGYKKFIVVKHLGSQTSCFEEFSERLVNAIKKLISELFNEKIIKLNEVSGLKQHERYGIILKNIIKMVKTSLEIDKVNLSSEKERLYKITFGNKSPIQGKEDVMNLYLQELNQELVNLLLKKIKIIDCNIYLSWAELNYKKSSFSLQRAIGIDCFYFADALKNNEQLSNFEHLMECLNQLASKPDPEVSLSEIILEELFSKEEGKHENIKESMKRYKEWNESIFDCIEKNKSNFDKEECLYLLEYLHFLTLQPGQEKYKQRVYTFTTKVLMAQGITDLFSIAIDYLLNHNGNNILEFSETNENFENFISHNVTFKSPQNLRFVLISLIKNPKKILSILLNIMIGHPNYEHVMIFPSNFFLLAPILKIRTENGKTILIKTLEQCMQNTEWNVKKFAHFVEVMEENKFGTDEIFNDLFIPYLQSATFNASNIKSVLNSMRKMQNKCTENLKIEELIYTVMKMISYLRQDTMLPKYVNAEILFMLIRVIEFLFQSKSQLFDAARTKFIVKNINTFLEPIDRPYLASLCRLTNQGIDIRDIIEDYERRCFIVINKIQENQEFSERFRGHLNDFTFLNEDFLRHLILRSTEFEYTKFGTECVLIHWNVFKWKNEIHAFEKFVQITIEACLLCLEFSDVSSPQSFPFLIKCLSRLSKSIFKLNATKTYESIYESLVQGIQKLKDSITKSQYSELYLKLLISINNISRKEPLTDILQQLFSVIHNFGCQCLKLSVDQKQVVGLLTTELIKLRIIHELISNAIELSASEAHIFISKIEKLLFSVHYEEEKNEEKIS